MPEQTTSLYMRMAAKTVDALDEIAKEERRSRAQMSGILMELGIEAWRERQQKKKEAGE